MICNRCGEEIQEGRWEHTHYAGKIMLGRDCCIDDPLGITSDKLLEYFVVKAFGYQYLELEWGYGDDKYSMCRKCQDELIGLIGKFFFSEEQQGKPTFISMLRKGEVAKPDVEVEGITKVVQDKEQKEFVSQYWHDMMG